MLSNDGTLRGIGAMPTRGERRERPSLAAAIEFYRTHGHMGPYAIRGGEGDPPAGGGGTGDPDPGKGAGGDAGDDDGEIPEDLSEAGKKALRAERKAKREALRKAADAETRAGQLQKDADELKRLRDEQAAKNGDWEKLAKEREGTVASLTTERDGWKTKFEALVKRLAPDVEKAWDELPAEITELYTGDENDVLAKQEHVAKHAKLIEKLKGAIKPGDLKPPKGGKPAGDGKGKPAGGTGDDDAPSPLSAKQILG